MEVTEKTRIYYVYTCDIPNNELRGVFLNKKDALRRKYRIREAMHQDPEATGSWPELESKTVQEFLRMFENDEGCCEEGGWAPSHMRSTYLWKKIRGLPLRRAKEDYERDTAEAKIWVKEYLKRKNESQN